MLQLKTHWVPVDYWMASLLIENSKSFEKKMMICGVFFHDKNEISLIWFIFECSCCVSLLLCAGVCVCVLVN